MVRIISAIAALAVVAFVGVSIGQKIGRSASQPKGVPTYALSNDERLGVGAAFPDVPLATTSGDTLSTQSLFRSGGKIVLFIDPQCPSCAPAASRWQEAIDEGWLTEGEVIGISTRTAKENETYRDEHGFSFAIVRDLENRFRDTYLIQVLPFEIIVDASGTIQEATANTLARVERDSVLRMLAS